MSRLDIKPTGVERFFGEEEIIVSKTDLNGKITYANQTFLKVAGYEENEVIGKPHSMIRHPDMPACVFKLLWDTISQGNEIFAYVVNLCKNGDHYWVFAHVTPTFNSSGDIIGYHSNRRTPTAKSIAHVKDLYARLRSEELKHPDKRSGLQASYSLLCSLLKDKNLEYEEFIWHI
jgi:PAS domain S-box-containing protein